MKRVISTGLALLVAMVLVTACAQPDNTGATNAATSERLVAEAWNTGNFAMMNDAVAENFVRHNPATWDPPVIESRQQFQDYITQIRTDFANFTVTVHNRMASGDMVAATWTVTGLHNESGKELSVDGITFSRFANGKMAEEWVSWDTYGVMQQLGMAPAPETSMK